VVIREVLPELVVIVWGSRDTVAGGTGTNRMRDPATDITEEFVFWADWVNAI
jgi:hypothetical protein